MKLVNLLIVTELMCIANCFIGSTLQIINFNLKMNYPFTSSLLYYTINVCLGLFKCNRYKVSKKQRLLIAIPGLLDSLANATNSLSYEFADLASIFLILTLEAPFSMALGALILKEKFTIKNIMSSIVCIVFAVTYTIIDAENSYEESKNKIVGDGISIISALSYALSSVLNEKFMGPISVQEYLSMQSAGGMTLSFCGALCFDSYRYKNMKPIALALYVEYAFFLYSFYYLTLFVIKKSSAVYYNVSTLATNFYTFIISIFVFQSEFQWLQIVPALGILCSVLIFFMDQPEPPQGDALISFAVDSSALENTQEYEIIKEENKE